jgi:SAM-dependent methyltransferase
MNDQNNVRVVLPRFAFPRTSVESRFDVVLRIARGRDVLHVGCSDAPYFAERIASGAHLHVELSKVARRLVGVDISEEGVAFLQRAGFENVVCADVEHLERCGLAPIFDLIVAGELIEHLPNPGRALEAMRSVLAPTGELLITVPNAFSMKGGLRALRGIEVVHEDHCYYFSPATIGRLLDLAGLQIVDLRYYSSPPSSRWRGFIDRTVFSFLRKVWPWMSDGLVILADVKKS